LIFTAIAGLFALDTFLADRERAANRSEARRLLKEGLQLMDRGAMPDAVDRLRSAVSAERENPVYQRALAAALVTAGEWDDAEAVLTERLQHDPLDAEASLLMARALAGEGDTRQAIAFYHRAIYGQWGAGAGGGRIRARFELVDLLASTHDPPELLAELLPLQTEAPTDVRTRKRIARLFIAAGAPTRAIEIFGDVVRRDRHDADGYAGLGEAELQLGNYRSACRHFATAVKLGGDDRPAEARLELCTRVLALDPTQRGLGPVEQHRRSRDLLAATLEAFENCTGPGPHPAQPPLADSARAALARPAPPSPTAGAVEENLDLAERLWRLRTPPCPMSPSGLAADLLLQRLAE
jgi:tetratricopeptide (TPR) repeat protein